MKKLEREYKKKIVQPEYKSNDVMLNKKYYVFKEDEVKPKSTSILKFILDVSIGLVFKIIQGR